MDKDFAGYTYGYNRSLLANRVHDVLTLIAFGTSLLKAKTVHLVGWGEMGVGRGAGEGAGRRRGGEDGRGPEPVPLRERSRTPPTR